MPSDAWYFDQNRLVDTPSRRHGIPLEKEQAFLQQTANFIQDMGRKLTLPIICINTAVLFTRRFYLFHSLKMFENFHLGAAALFLAAKVEEHPRKVEHVCSTAKYLGVFKKDVKDTVYIEEMMINESAILLTLGFQIQVLHPHAQILSACDRLKCSKEFSSTAYLLATYCLHLTNMSVKYRPPAIACLSIHMASVTTQINLPSTSEQQWFHCIDPTMTEQLLEELTTEFRNSLAHCPEKCKKRTLANYFENLLKNNKLGSGQWGLPYVKSPDSHHPTVPTPSQSSCSQDKSINPKLNSPQLEVTSNLKSENSLKTHKLGSEQWGLPPVKSPESLHTTVPTPSQSSNSQDKSINPKLNSPQLEVTSNLKYENLLKTRKLGSGQWGLPPVKIPESLHPIVLTPCQSSSSQDKSINPKLKSSQPEVNLNLKAESSSRVNQTIESRNQPPNIQETANNCTSVKERLAKDSTISHYQSNFDPSRGAVIIPHREKKWDLENHNQKRDRDKPLYKDAKSSLKSIFDPGPVAEALQQGKKKQEFEKSNEKKHQRTEPEVAVQSIFDPIPTTSFQQGEKKFQNKKHIEKSADKSSRNGYESSFQNFLNPSQETAVIKGEKISNCKLTASIPEMPPLPRPEVKIETEPPANNEQSATLSSLPEKPPLPKIKIKTESQAKCEKTTREPYLPHWEIPKGRHENKTDQPNKDKPATATPLTETPPLPKDKHKTDEAHPTVKIESKAEVQTKKHKTAREPYLPHPEIPKGKHENKTDQPIKLKSFSETPPLPKDKHKTVQAQPTVEIEGKAEVQRKKHKTAREPYLSHPEIPKGEHENKTDQPIKQRSFSETPPVPKDKHKTVEAHPTVEIEGKAKANTKKHKTAREPYLSHPEIPKGEHENKTDQSIKERSFSETPPVPKHKTVEAHPTVEIEGKAKANTKKHKTAREPYLSHPEIPKGEHENKTDQPIKLKSFSETPPLPKDKHKTDEAHPTVVRSSGLKLTIKKNQLHHLPSSPEKPSKSERAAQQSGTVTSKDVKPSSSHKDHSRHSGLFKPNILKRQKSPNPRSLLKSSVTAGGDHLNRTTDHSRLTMTIRSEPRIKSHKTHESHHYHSQSSIDSTTNPRLPPSTYHISKSFSHPGAHTPQSPRSKKMDFDPRHSQAHLAPAFPSFPYSLQQTDKEMHSEDYQPNPKRFKPN